MFYLIFFFILPVRHPSWQNLTNLGPRFQKQFAWQDFITRVFLHLLSKHSILFASVFECFQSLLLVYSFKILNTSIASYLNLVSCIRNSFDPHLYIIKLLFCFSYVYIMNKGQNQTKLVYA